MARSAAMDFETIHTGLGTAPGAPHVFTAPPADLDDAMQRLHTVLRAAAQAQSARANGLGWGSLPGGQGGDDDQGGRKLPRGSTVAVDSASEAKRSGSVSLTVLKAAATPALAWAARASEPVQGNAVAEAAAMPTQRGFWQISGKSEGPRSRFSRELAVRRLKVFLPSARSSKVAK